MNNAWITKDVADLTCDVAKVVTAPVQVAVDVSKAVVKPVKELAEELVGEVKEAVK